MATTTANEIEIVISARNNTGRGLDAARSAVRRFHADVDRLTDINIRANNRSDAGLDDALRSMRRFRDDADRLGNGASDALQRALRRGLVDGATNAADGATHIVAIFLRNTSDAAARAASNIAASTATAAVSGGEMTAATGGLNLLVGALLAVATAAAIAVAGIVALAPIVLVAGGAMGALTTIIAGGSVALATLAVGFSGVTDAIGALDGPADKLAEALAKLSPNARAFVEEIGRIKSAFSSIKALVQDKLFDGLNLSLRDLATKWLPAARDILGGMAGHLNSFAKQFMAAFGQTSFIENMKQAAEGLGRFFDRIGLSLGGLVDGFGRLAAGSVPFLERLGELLGGAIDHFAVWMKQVDESGALAKFMEDAADALQDLWEIGGLVFSIIGDIIEILFPSSKRASEDFLGGVKEMLTELEKWLADPENQEKIRKWISDLQDFADTMVNDVIPAVTSVVETIDEWVKRGERWAKNIENWSNNVVEFFRKVGKTASDTTSWILYHWNGLTSWFSGMRGRIDSATSGMWDGVRDSSSRAINGIMSSWSGLRSVVGSGIGGMAQGGIGGGLTMVGERGREMVRLPQGSTVIGHGQTEAMLAGGGGGGGSRTELAVSIAAGASEKLVRELLECLRYEVRITGGGSAQALLGQPGKG